MPTARENLEVKNKVLVELWNDYYNLLTKDNDVFSSSFEYQDTSLYDNDTLEEFFANADRVGAKFKEIQSTLKRNQNGVGRVRDGKETVQLFNSKKPYGQKSGYTFTSVFNPLTNFQNIVQGKIKYMIDHWNQKASIAVQEGAPIGTTKGPSILGDSNVNINNMPGSNHQQPNAAGRALPNRYKQGSGYKRKFLTYHKNPAQQSSDNDLAVLAKGRFNEGQVLGGKSWGSSYRSSTLRSLDFSNPKAFLGSALDLVLGGGDRTELRKELDNLESLRVNITKKYVPGFNRITQPFLARSSLDTYLQQNLLLPPKTGREQKPITYSKNNDPLNGYAGYEPQVRPRTVIQEENTGTQKAFRNLYVNNPVRPPADFDIKNLSDPKRFNRGAIAGTSIRDIERQGEALPGRPGSANMPPEIFSHESHDEKRMTNDMKSRGFSQNIGGTIRGPSQGALKPAVENIDSRLYGNNTTDKQSAHAQLGDLQYFPFLFTTENKVNENGGSPWQQVCYLQATIDNLNESFVPMWQAKHFFGRTEQIQTYTFTERTIDLSFMIYADDMRRLQNVWERVSWLAQQTYGQYEFGSNGPNSRLLNGPIVRMTIGDIYRGVPGFIKSLSYDWNALGAGGKWEMTQNIRMPMACKVQLNYQVIHDDNPYRDYNLYSGLSRDGGMLNISDNRKLIPGINDTADPSSVNGTYADLLDINTSV